jgi:NADPH-dependent curcumin reductase CurA
MSMNVRAVTLKRFPDGVPNVADFDVTELPDRAPDAAEVRVDTHWLSLDPYQRGVISGRHMGHRLDLGEVIVGATVGVVRDSRDERFVPGDWVVGNGGWRSAWVEPGASLRKLDPADAPPSTALGVLGMPGLTAYAGLLHLGLPTLGDTVVVSAAAGPVGATVGQLARAVGARTVGIVGSSDKAELIRSRFGFDEAIDYKREALNEALARTCPERIDVYFDNVGGATLEAAINHLNLRARVVLCGLITQYNDSQRPAGPNLGPVIGARAELKGLVVYDHFDKLDRWVRLGAALIRRGALNYQEDIADGLEQAPAAFARLMRGENIGKSLVRVAPL